MAQLSQGAPVCKLNEVTSIAITQISLAQTRVLHLLVTCSPGIWGHLSCTSMGTAVLDMCPGVTAEALALSQCHAVGKSMVTLGKPSARGSLGLRSISNVFVEVLCSLLDLVGALWGVALS